MLFEVLLELVLFCSVVGVDDDFWNWFGTGVAGLVGGVLLLVGVISPFIASLLLQFSSVLVVLEDTGCVLAGLACSELL